jgi:hypothetical protein
MPLWRNGLTVEGRMSDVRDLIFSILSVASDIKDDKRKLMADYTITPNYFTVVS